MHGSLGKSQGNITTWKHRFLCYLNKGNIIGGEYRHIKRVYKNFGINKQGEYHDFYVPSNNKTKTRKIKLRDKNKIRTRKR